MDIISLLRYISALILLSIIVLVLLRASPSHHAPSRYWLIQEEEQKGTSISRRREFDNNYNTNDGRAEMNSDLLYGVEIAFLFPVEVYHKTVAASRRQKKENSTSASASLRTTKSGRRRPSPKSEAMDHLVRNLQESGLSAMRSAHIASSNEKVSVDAGINTVDKSKFWKIQWERFGFEVASPIAPSFREIGCMLSVVQDFGCFVHPELTSMHINIDARGRSLGEARNVYKNILAVEPVIDHLRFTKKSTILGGEASNMGEAFHSIEEAYDSLDKTTSFQSLIHLGQHYDAGEGSSKMNEQRVRYKVGMKLKTNGTLSAPKTFEFRGLEASFDPAVTISWLKMGIELTGTSYMGNVLEPFQRSEDEAWAALFGELVLDGSIEKYFGNRRTIMKKKRLRQKRSDDLLAIQAALCRVRDDPFTKQKLFREMYCQR